MPEHGSISRETLTHMARQHAESSLAAGVEWIERAPASASVSGSAASPQSSPSTASLPDSQPSALFDASLPPAVEMTPEEKKLALATLDEKEVVGCTRCPVLVQNRTQTVFGVGSPTAELMFVGEAPGADEDAKGEPFVGAAGQLLTRIIEACRMKREDVYIANILKCRPPGNRTPLPDECANCIGYLARQIDIIRPKFICCLGAVAAQNLLQTSDSIGRLRGRFHQYRGIQVLCTYHPAYLLRTASAKKDVWNDMKLLMARMGRPVE